MQVPMKRLRSALNWQYYLYGEPSLTSIQSRFVLDHPISGSTSHLPNRRKSSSKANAVLMPSRFMMAKLVQSTKLNRLSGYCWKIAQTLSSSAGVMRMIGVVVSPSKRSQNCRADS